MTNEQLHAAREWLSDCVWADEDVDSIAEMPAEVILRAVARHYAGGLAAFLLAVS